MGTHIFSNPYQKPPIAIKWSEPSVKLSQKKSIKTYRTAWFFSDATKLDKQVYEMITNFMNRTKAFANKQLWSKYAIILYLSGARRVEPFLHNMTVSRIKINNKIYYRITGKINAKHKTKNKRVINPQLFKAYNVYESGLFNYLLEGRDTMTFDFTPLLSEVSRRKFNSDEEQHMDVKLMREIMGSITLRFSGMFKANITNGEIRQVNGGVTPHILRHVRAYDLWINEGMKPHMVQRLFGWSRLTQLEYYADIMNAMREKELLDEYEKDTRQSYEKEMPSL